MSDSELKRIGYTDNDIFELRNFSFENALLERAQLAPEQLSALGYTEEQIALLKQYDGSELTSDSAVLRATAVCTGSIVKGVGEISPNKISYGYRWSWNVMPIHIRDDRAALSWQAVNPNAAFFSVSASSKSCLINYYSTYTGKLFDVQSFPVKPAEEFSGCYVDFPLQQVIPEEPDGTLAIWAKEGIITVSLSPDGNDMFNLIKTYGSVAHAIKNCDIGFSIETVYPPIISFSFTPFDDISTEAEVNYTIYSDGRMVDNYK